MHILTERTLQLLIDTQAVIGHGSNGWSLGDDLGLRLNEHYIGLRLDDGLGLDIVDLEHLVELLSIVMLPSLVGIVVLLGQVLLNGRGFRLGGFRLGGLLWFDRLGLYRLFLFDGRHDSSRFGLGRLCDSGLLGILGNFLAQFTDALVHHLLRVIAMFLDHEQESFQLVDLCHQS